MSGGDCVCIAKDLRANPFHAQWRDTSCIVEGNESERHFNLSTLSTKGSFLTFAIRYIHTNAVKGSRSRIKLGQPWSSGFKDQVTVNVLL